MTYKGYDINIDDPATWPKGGNSGPAVAVIALDADELALLDALGDFHCDDEFPLNEWPYCPDALVRVREKLSALTGHPPLTGRSLDAGPAEERAETLAEEQRAEQEACDRAAGRE